MKHASSMLNILTRKIVSYSLETKESGSSFFLLIFNFVKFKLKINLKKRQVYKSFLKQFDKNYKQIINTATNVNNDKRKRSIQANSVLSSYNYTSIYDELNLFYYNEMLNLEAVN